jgi:hypothetical protein
MYILIRKLPGNGTRAEGVSGILRELLLLGGVDTS